MNIGRYFKSLMGLAVKIMLIRRMVGEENAVDKASARLHYPDGSGGLLGDRGILRNAVQFSTPQRAWRTLETLGQPSFQHLGNRQRAMLALEGFQAMMVSLEDLQAWLFVLRDWQPGTSQGSLFALLDRVQVGRQRGDADWREEAALEFLDSLTPATYRELVRLPADEELLVAG